MLRDWYSISRHFDLQAHDIGIHKSQESPQIEPPTTYLISLVVCQPIHKSWNHKFKRSVLILIPVMPELEIAESGLKDSLALRISKDVMLVITHEDNLLIFN